MQGQLLGKDVTAIRRALCLTTGQLASVLGVHPSSVHRWEAAADAPANAEGVARTLLIALRPRVNAGAAAKKRAAMKGYEISNTLAVGGLLLALGLLVAFAASDD